MDKALSNRNDFIGGSEANMLYLNYNTKTFINWWSKKLTDLSDDGFINKSMSVGTIIESDIVDLYESINQVKGKRDVQEIKGIARASTDYILNDKVIDIKATNKAFEWFLRGTVPINYRRQLLHYCYVLGLNKASIVAYQVDEDLLDNPFIKLDKNKLFEIPVKITKQDLATHKVKLDFLEHCKQLNIMPAGGKK